MFVKRWWGRLRDWWKRTWTNIRPGPETRSGVLIAAIVTVVAGAILGGLNLKSGFGVVADLLFAFLVAALGIGLIVLATAIVISIVRRLPKVASGVVIGACIFVSMIMPPAGFVFVPLAIIFGAALATIWKGDFSNAHLSKKILTIVIGLASLATIVTLLVILEGEGPDTDRIQLQASASPQPAPLAAPNPSEKGPYAVKHLFYGSGTDQRRPEYNAQVALKTPTVDASPFFKDFKGWQEKTRRYYWGFGTDKFPLNARVWYPDGNGPFPLVLIVHGNHDMAEFSDPGYRYLGELLASRGFILASIDENFLNGWIIELPKEQATRGWMLLEHLKLWRKWNEQSGNPFFGKVDMHNIALMGHSRGGEAAATAAFFNRLSYYPDDATIPFSYGFDIKSIVAIAPPDGQYKPAGERRTIENVNYLTLQGSNDGDVSSFGGSSQFDRVKFTGDQDSNPMFKAEIYAYRANHGQFNTVWGRSDAGEPMGRYLDLRPLLNPEDQRRISKTYISAFLEATLRGKREYVPLFRDFRVGRDWLPATLYINRYLDATYRPIANYSEDADVTSTTVPGGHISAENLSIWKEGRIPTRQGDRGYNGVFLGWNRENNNKIPSYSITLPPDPSRGSTLTLSLAATDQQAPEPGSPKEDTSKKKEPKKDEVTDLTVEIETVNGTKTALPLSRFGTLMPPFRARFTKFAMLDDYAYKKADEPIFQTFDLPLHAFGVDDSKQVKVVRLRFDKTVSRVVILSQIGFEK
ncbi:MAG TPA: hypothetical protein VGL53_00930 [Bryobacteraceae bacterium]|jgi:dienelactone hydrolase